jgi:mannobiose 2-epimerase
MNIHILGKYIAFAIMAFALFFSSCSRIHVITDMQCKDVIVERDSISTEMRKVLETELSRWYPLALDTAYGGYYSDMNFRWELTGPQQKMIVTQARHVWSAANAGMFFQKNTQLRNIAGYGIEFLRNKMWDPTYGGFYDLVDRSGEPVFENGQIIKRAYGNSFAIYGLSAYYRASGDTAALQLAKKTFNWLEQHSYDPQYGGYFQFLARDGTPFTEGYDSTPPKDYNSLIHILESFTELYKVWPDSLLRERLYSMLTIIRDTVTTEKGYMRLYFNRDWSHISQRDSGSAGTENRSRLDYVSFGHDVETAYLMLEASDALMLDNDETTLKVAKTMVDHALDNGWDKEHGGFYDAGFYFHGEGKISIVDNAKEWWPQVEALNTFLMMSNLFTDDSHDYYEKFCLQWNYCKKYLIDHEYGGWYWAGIDTGPGNTHSPKGTIWKGNYHTSRALINCMNRLRNQTTTTEQQHFDPVNHNTTREARQLLDYLYLIGGNHIIAGHHNYVDRPDTFLHRVKELTGKAPQIYGLDFNNYYREGYAEKLVQEAYRKFKEGYTITLMWHAGRPQDDPPFGWKESIQGKMTDAEWNNLITPGTPLHTRWMAQVDTVAAYLKKLQVLGVPVLWRPYHEANGVWFWWGNRKGENGSARLYRMMFDRFVNYHRLNNLIWVWNTNAPRQLRDDEAFAYEDYFPGLEYVDVLAADIYHRDYRQSHHDELVQLGRGKLIALGEVGEVPTPEILDRQPMWAWFMIWSNFVNTHNTPEQIQQLYAYPKILTHENFSQKDQ